MLPDPMPYFAGLQDLRRETKNKLHKLTDIVLIVLCAGLRTGWAWKILPKKKKSGSGRFWNCRTVYPRTTP
jgi:hypothetical protein